MQFSLQTTIYNTHCLALHCQYSHSIMYSLHYAQCYILQHIALYIHVALHNARFTSLDCIVLQRTALHCLNYTVYSALRTGQCTTLSQLHSIQCTTHCQCTTLSQLHSIQCTTHCQCTATVSTTQYTVHYALPMHYTVSTTQYTVHYALAHSLHCTTMPCTLRCSLCAAQHSAQH